MRYKAIVEYNGTNYQGWQRQPDYLSVQESIEKCLSRLLDTSITIYSSGRTDAGVHAKGQVFHFDSEEIKDINKFLYSLNRILPNDINILSLEKVDDNFNARFNVKDKTYEYKIAFSAKQPFMNDTCYCCPYPTDVNKVINALKLFEGKHNFQDFTSKEEDEKNFVREIYSITIILKENFLTIQITGDGFMRYMVRDIVGTSLAYGQGYIDLAFIKYHLQECKEREIVKYKAPAQGLYLIKVRY